ncbi:MAG: family 43 glycosylhydrolase [Candidatus Saccharimonadales bacterium]
MRKVNALGAIGIVEPKRIWQPENNRVYSQSLWAPELHQRDEKWYIYFAAGKQDDHYNNQRMYVLEGEGTDPQSAEYNLNGMVADDTDQWAIDGTIMEHANKKRYFIWSGRDKTVDLAQHLYIAEMDKPWSLRGERVRIASPEKKWEKNGGKINEGPAVLRQGDRRHIIYSASHSLSDSYCLGQLTLHGDNPLNPSHWEKKKDPIYTSHNEIIAPGHASFIQSNDETWGWMIYHTARYPGAGWNRHVRLAAFILQENGTLNFSNSVNRRAVKGKERLGQILGKIIHK